MTAAPHHRTPGDKGDLAPPAGAHLGRVPLTPAASSAPQPPNLRRRIVAAAAGMAVLAALGGCVSDAPPSRGAGATPVSPAASALAPSAAPSQAATTTDTAKVAPGGTFTAFAEPCPAVAGRAGSRVGSGASVECAYGETFPKVKSVSAISRPDGGPDAKEVFAALRSKALATKTDGLISRDVAGLGDQAFLVIRFSDNQALLVVRKGNAVVQTSSTVDTVADREGALTELQAQDRVITDLARALLAQLR